MESKYPTLLLAISLVISLSNNVMQAKAQALCPSQFALVNEACSYLRSTSAESNSTLLHERSHHHHQHHDYDSACCRRLEGLDNACMCGAMIRLPHFVNRLKHKITLSAGEGCDVTYECAGIV